jgi:hypothetical protein
MCSKNDRRESDTDRQPKQAPGRGGLRPAGNQSEGVIPGPSPSSNRGDEDAQEGDPAEAGAKRQAKPSKVKPEDVRIIPKRAGERAEGMVLGPAASRYYLRKRDEARRRSEAKRPPSD